ncbi:hypothetical protein AMJ57_03255 [Parcubacteria bacterium SG8_24]|nr:MAG: hypothetical protein AMJ57_03255 [Parcubacteria bacterium SG8_24]
MRPIGPSKKRVFRRSARDFSKKRYGNPLFPQHRRVKGRAIQDRQRMKRYAGLALMTAVAGLLFWYLFWSPTFRIESVEITGGSDETKATIHELIHERMVNRRRALVVSQSNIFVCDRRAIEDDIRSRFYLESLEVRKRLPDTVVIELTERAPVSVLFADDRFLALDGSGFVIRELTEREILSLKDLPPDMVTVLSGELGAEVVEIETERGTVSIARGSADAAAEENRNPHPLIVLERGGTPLDRQGFAPGTEAVPGTTLGLIIRAYERLPDITGAGVRWFALPNLSESIDVSMYGGWHVYLSELIPFETQGERLSLIIKEKIGSRMDELEYVDLRYDERIFFRFRQ